MTTFKPGIYWFKEDAKSDWIIGVIYKRLVYENDTEPVIFEYTYFTEGPSRFIIQRILEKGGCIGPEIKEPEE